MAVYRTHKTKDFTTMANFHLRDKTLSLKAKGLLSMMLSLPEDWVYSIEGLVSISKEGERAVKSALAELQDVGYVVVTKKYPNKTSNKITYEYDVYEMPKLEQELHEAQHSVAVQNQAIQNVALQNVGLLNTNNKILNTKEKELDTNVSNSKKKESQKHRYGEYRHVLLTDKQVDSLKQKFGDKWNLWVQTLDEGIQLKGYHYNDHYLAILKWAKKEEARQSSKSGMKTDYLDNL